MMTATRDCSDHACGNALFDIIWYYSILFYTMRKCMFGRKISNIDYAFARVEGSTYYTQVYNICRTFGCPWALRSAE